MKMTETTKRPGYTLVEILVAVTLSLLLLLGVTDMFRNVGDTINETQATINMGQNLTSTAMVLRNDLGGIDPKLATKASDLVSVGSSPATGYLEIIEGQGAPPDVIVTQFSHGTLGNHAEGKHLPMNWTAYTPESTDGDLTVADNDDILAFTILGKGAFRGFVNGNLQDSSSAEVVWFVRGNNLYRRVLIIPVDNVTPSGNYGSDDVPFRNDGATKVLLRDGELHRREYRFGRPNGGSFPFPIHGGTTIPNWYYLRMPTLEETIHSSWQATSPNLPTLSATGLKCNGFNMSLFPNNTSWGDTSATPNINQFWDFWEGPNNWVDSSGNTFLDPLTGSMSDYVSNPRNSRAGEDIILTNVIGFDVKVWNPYWVPCGSGNNAWEWAPPQFVDLGQDRFYLLNTNTNTWGWYDVKYDQDLTNTPTGIPTYHATNKNVAGYGFTLKGRYNTVSGVRRTLSSGTDKWHEACRIRRVNSSSANPTYHDYSGTTHMACVYDSWSSDYLANQGITGLDVNVDDGTGTGNTYTDYGDPPYVEPLTGIQVTIRCFEPQSGNIKQIRVARYFNPNP